MNVLLVQPDFPLPPKSANHRGFLPIGLLKLAAYYRAHGDKVRLVRGSAPTGSFRPHLILVTSLFTYWAHHVRESVAYYKATHPAAEIVVGGIYATLMPRHCLSYTGCDRVYIGIHKGAEACAPAYDLARAPHQIVRSSRGCPRRCAFCGSWLISPRFTAKASVREEITMNRVLFYDDNLLLNPHIDAILEELAGHRISGKRLRCECQAGLDGRVLLERPHLARMLKLAGFVYPRIAWDGPASGKTAVAEQLRILRSAGFRPQDTFVFMLYNWDIPFRDMEAKRKACARWGVQISDCRYRPLDQVYDSYRPGAPDRVHQTRADYYIHEPLWTDAEVRQFRKNVREQNISLRCAAPYDRPKELRAKAAKRPPAPAT